MEDSGWFSPQLCMCWRGRRWRGVRHAQWCLMLHYVCIIILSRARVQQQSNRPQSQDDCVVHLFSYFFRSPCERKLLALTSASKCQLVKTVVLWLFFKPLLNVTMNSRWPRPDLHCSELGGISQSDNFFPLTVLTNLIQTFPSRDFWTFSTYWVLLNLHQPIGKQRGKTRLFFWRSWPSGVNSPSSER